MNITKFMTMGALLVAAFAGAVFAQIIGVTNTSQWVAAKRQLLAVKYSEDKGTAVNLSGTALSPRALGKADVEYKHGRAKIKLEMENLGHPQSLGGFYTTYILWAVAPEGQAESLVELPAGGKFKVDATTKLQTFGLMITAEPHSRVALPSPVIVAENSLRPGTKGRLETSQIEYSGDPGTLYIVSTPNSPALDADYNTPLLILGARRAVEIAERADAKIFADMELREATEKLALLERDWPRSRKPSDLRKNAEKNSGLAHDAMRLGERARSLSVERAAQARLAAERQQAGNEIAVAQSDAERARLEAERAANDAARARREADRAGNSERDQAERAAKEAALARERVAQAQAETERAKANEEQARADADKARLQTEQAQRERDAAQKSLYVSLSAILDTRREARGIIVNLSDVLFDTGQATLKPGAREKLSKLAGILLAYSGGYMVETEGHTDSVGSAESNLKLSQGRADAVRDYLLQNGVKPAQMMAAHGFGEVKPVADNDTAAGRQVNRRVEIIIADQPQVKAVNQ